MIRSEWLGLPALCCIAIALVASCGNDQGEGSNRDECTSENACQTGQVCYTGGQTRQCVPKCESTSDCSGNRSCVEQVLGDNKGCEPADRGGDSNGDGPSNGDANTGGGENLDSGMADGDDKTGSGIQFIRITDITEREQGSCDSSVEYPGAEIFGVELLRSNGSIRAYGAILSGSDTLTGSTGILDGRSTEYEGESSNGNCPAFKSANFFALGCGGTAVVGLSRFGRSFASLQSGQTLVVKEYGEQCGGDRATHAIRVDACPRGTTESEVRNGNVTCDNTLATGSGTLDIDISLDDEN